MSGYICGIGQVGPGTDLPETLEDMIYDATLAALTDAKLTRGQVDAVCLAASDLLDGRGISTMTLTGSTGSLARWEYRVCDDSLVALDLAGAHMDSGLASLVTVSSWCKGTVPVDPVQIAATAVEPVYHRQLPVPPFAAEALVLGSPTPIDDSAWDLCDAAISLVVSAEKREGTIAEVGRQARSTERYLRPTRAAADRLKELVASADDGADSVLLCGQLATEQWTDWDLGAVQLTDTRGAAYAAGLLGVAAAIDRGSGRYVIASAAGLGAQCLVATALEVHP